MAAGHPRAVDAALTVAAAGGNAVDSSIAAHAMSAVCLPDACGLGGDALFLVSRAGRVVAINGTGRSPAAAPTRVVHDAGLSVTVPGAVHAWETLSRFAGTLPLGDVLAPAIAAARDGIVADTPLIAAVDAQRARLLRGGAESWALLAARAGEVVEQPALADTLAAIGERGAAAFYRDDVAAAIRAAVGRDGGVLSVDDLREHRTVITEPVTVSWNGGAVHVQPPTSQGVLLAMALQWLEQHGRPPTADTDHVAIELSEAAFGFRDRCARDGRALLREPLDVDVTTARRRGGPRGYLHTTGVATADANGTVVSSLLSVFDDFGSATFVPECGFVLNNRGGGFTDAPNDPGPGRRPVHTLAPAIVELPTGATALATPGADGQTQTLLQVLMRDRYDRCGLDRSIAAPRWRSEGGELRIERSHPSISRLRDRGHAVVEVDDGHQFFGAVVAASAGAGPPEAVGDWRRQVTTGGR